MASADEEDQRVAAQLVDRAGGVSPLTGLVIAQEEDRTITVGMLFETSSQASDNLQPRVDLAAGDAPGQGGSFADRFRSLGRGGRAQRRTPARAGRRRGLRVQRHLDAGRCCSRPAEGAAEAAWEAAVRARNVRAHVNSAFSVGCGRTFVRARRCAGPGRAGRGSRRSTVTGPARGRRDGPHAARAVPSGAGPGGAHPSYDARRVQHVEPGDPEDLQPVVAQTALAGRVLATAARPGVVAAVVLAHDARLDVEQVGDSEQPAVPEKTSQFTSGSGSPASMHQMSFMPVSYLDRLCSQARSRAALASGTPSQPAWLSM